MATGDLFPWSDGYATGVRMVDADHHDLFETVNALYRSVERSPVLSAQERAALIDRLLRYTREHFEREEALMAQYNYPHLARHRRLHHKFIRFVLAVRRINVDAPAQLDLRRLVSYLGLWLEHHITKMDQDYVRYFTGVEADQEALSGVDYDQELTRLDPAADNAGPVSVTVQVGPDQVALIQRIAAELRDETLTGQSIQALLGASEEISLDEAKKIAQPVLRLN